MPSLPERKLSQDPTFPNLMDGDRVIMLRTPQDEPDITKRNGTASLETLAVAVSKFLPSNVVRLDIPGANQLLANSAPDPQVQEAAWYTIDGDWNATGNDTRVYLRGLNTEAFSPVGILHDAQGVYSFVQVNVATATTSPISGGGTIDAYTKAQTDALLSQKGSQPVQQQHTQQISDLQTKVATAAIIPATGFTVTPYTNTNTASAATLPGQTLLLRGSQPAGLAFTASATLDGYGANMGNGTLQVGTFPPSTATQKALLMGFASSGRVVSIAQNSGTANDLEFPGVHLSGNGWFEVFGLQSGSQNVIDSIALVDCSGHKTGTSSAIAGVSTALVVFQQRTDLGHRKVAYHVRNCDLQNDVGPIFGGPITRGSTIFLEGTTRVTPAGGHTVQECTSVDSGNYVALTDAEILADNRANVLANLTASAILALVDTSASNVGVFVLGGKLVFTAAAGTGGGTGGGTGAPAYDGPLQFRPATASTSYLASFASTTRFALGALANAPAGATATAQLNDGAFLSFTDFNAAVEALPEVNVTSGFTFAILLVASSATLLSCDLPFTYAAPRPLAAGTPITVLPAVRDFRTNLLSAAYTDYDELDAQATYTVETNATSVQLAQIAIGTTTFPLNGVAVLDGATLVSSQPPGGVGSVATTTVALPGSGLRLVQFVAGVQQRAGDAGVRQGTFLARAGLQFNAGASVRIVHPARQLKRVVLISDSILSGIISDAGSANYTPATQSSIQQLRALLPDWEIYVLGYGNAQWRASLGDATQQAAAVQAILTALGGATTKVVYGQRGINDYGTGGASPTQAAQVAGQVFDALRARDNSIQFVQQSLFPSAYEATAGGGGLTAADWRTQFMTKLTQSRPWVHTVEGSTICPYSSFGPDGLHASIAGQQVLAQNLSTYLLSL